MWPPPPRPPFPASRRFSVFELRSTWPLLFISQIAALHRLCLLFRAGFFFFLITFRSGCHCLAAVQQTRHGDSPAASRRVVKNISRPPASSSDSSGGEGGWAVWTPARLETANAKCKSPPACWQPVCCHLLWCGTSSSFKGTLERPRVGTHSKIGKVPRGVFECRRSRDC